MDNVWQQYWSGIDFLTFLHGLKINLKTGRIEYYTWRERNLKIQKSQIIVFVTWSNLTNQSEPSPTEKYVHCLVVLPILPFKSDKNTMETPRDMDVALMLWENRRSADAFSGGFDELPRVQVWWKCADRDRFITWLPSPTQPGDLGKKADMFEGKCAG